MNQWVKARWKRFFLWLRWWPSHGCSLPDNDPTKNIDLRKRVIEPRLGRRAKRIRKLEGEQTIINERREKFAKRLRAAEASEDPDVLSTIPGLKRSIQLRDETLQKKRHKIEVARRRYNQAWKLYQDANGLDPAWGDREQFLINYLSYTSTTC